MLINENQMTEGKEDEIAEMEVIMEEVVQGEERMGGSTRRDK